MTIRSSNCAKAFLRAARPSRRARFGSSCNARIAAASAGAFRTGTMSPSCPSVTTSRQPGTSVVISGKAQAVASIKLFGRPSP
jgi:hypothetical protein